MHNVDTAITEAIATFPATFAMRAYPGLEFRISSQSSYVNDSGVVMLYTEVHCPENVGTHRSEWGSFAKGTIQELRREVRPLPLS